MDSERRPIQAKRCVPVLLGAAVLLCTAPVPAHGQGADPSRAANAGSLVGFSGQRWSTDYGIGRGRCERDRIVVSGGDARRDLVAEHDEHLRNRTVGIIGARSPALLLSTRAPRVAGTLDARDRACISHVLELGSVGRDVSWTNPAAKLGYVATLRDEPLPAGQARCRVLLLATLPAGAPAAMPLTARRNVERLVACETGGGTWAFR